MKRALVLGIVFSVTSIFFTYGQCHSARPSTKFITIGTGGITGVYYPTGGAIAKIINKKRREYGIRAMVESTGGSMFNINAVKAGDLEFGIVRSDRQYKAYKGLGLWREKGPQYYLRSVFSIHSEPLTLVAADDAKIVSLRDLKGKRVSIGSPRSAEHEMSILALENAGIDYRKDLEAEDVKIGEAVVPPRNGRIDAFFYSVGHPSEILKEATEGSRKVHFVPITGVEELLKKYPYYAKAVIPIKLYPRVSNKEDIKTFGLKATLITSSKVPDEVVYAITKEVFENLQDFKKFNPAYYGLTKRNMLEALSAPIHPGAMRYYKEMDLK